MRARFSYVALILLCACSHISDTDPLAPIPVNVDPDDLLPPPLVQIWRRPADGDLSPTVAPAVGNRLVFIGSGDELLALRAEDGSGAWQVNVGAPLSRAPEPAGQRLVVATDEAILWYTQASAELVGRLGIESEPVAFRVSGEDVIFANTRSLQRAGTTGQVWRTEVAGITALATPPDGRTAYAVTEAGVLLAFDADTGDERWRYESDGETRLAPPAATDERVYLTGTRGALVACRARDGKVMWTRRLGVDVRASPAVVDGVLWVAPFDATLRGFNAGNGSAVFTLPLSSRTYVDLLAYPPWVIVGPRYGPWLRVQTPSRLVGARLPTSATVTAGDALSLAPAAGPAGLALVNGDGSVVLLRPQKES